MAKKSENTAEIGFEEQIWKAADKLRGNLDASEYKSVILGLIFLKYISDKFDERYQELVDEGDGFEEDRDEYSYRNIFYVPASARWSEIAAAAHEPEIGKVIDEAMAPNRSRKSEAQEYPSQELCPGKNWISAALAMWWTFSPMFKWLRKAIRGIFLVELMSTA